MLIEHLPLRTPVTGPKISSEDIEMTLWTIIGGALSFGLFALAVSRWRARAGTVPEAVPSCDIAELEPGRFRIVGRVMAVETSPSAVDGAECVYAERAEYRSVGSGWVPLLKEVEHRAVCHPFYLEDGTGQVLVDPGRALIDCATASADGGMTAERRLRAGEEVSLVASFTPAEEVRDVGDGPYRARARQWMPIADETGPMRLSHRTEPSMVSPPPDDLTAFLGGVGAMMVLMGGLLAFVTAFVL